MSDQERCVAEQPQPTEMYVCEISRLILHADQNYVFRVHPDCAGCKAYFGAEQPSREQAVDGLIRHLGQALRQWKSYAEEFEDVDLDSDSTTEAEMYRAAKSAYEASRGGKQ